MLLNGLQKIFSQFSYDIGVFNTKLFLIMDLWPVCYFIYFRHPTILLDDGFDALGMKQAD